MRVLLLLCLCVYSSFVCGLSRDEWRNRTVYQVLTDRFSPLGTPTPCNNLHTYCGGTFDGITSKLDYIQGMGFDAIWISPIVSQTDDPSSGSFGYHGYWLRDLYSINTYFGTELSLSQLVSEAHNKGIAVMLDVVGNHVGNLHDDVSIITPFNQPSHYHSPCQIVDWSNQQQVETCRLANLPDLDQSNSFVQSTLNAWIHDVVSKYDFDGIRIDTVPEVASNFWPGFAAASGVFAIGEVFNGDPQYVSHYTQESGILDSVLSYPLFFTLRNVFAQKQSMRQIESMLATYQKTFPKTLPYMGTFVDNHDNARFLSSQADMTLYRNALVFTLCAEGIPIIYYGTEQSFSGGSDPANREPLWSSNFDTSAPLYQFISSVNSVRRSHGNDFYGSSQVQRYADDEFYAFTRGTSLVLLSNVGSNAAPLQRTITYHPYRIGDQLCNVLASPGSDCVQVSGSGVSVTIEGGYPKIYVMQR